MIDLGFLAKDEAVVIYFPMVAGGVGQTGKTITLTMVKNGGATMTSTGATIFEVGSGVYGARLKEQDVNTYGPTLMLATAAACDDTFIFFRVAEDGVLDVGSAVATELTQAGLRLLNEEVRRVRGRIKPGGKQTL